MSRRRFCHLFNTEMSLSPSDFVYVLRMREAERLLEETLLSVKEIRVELGNLDRTHFSPSIQELLRTHTSTFQRCLTIHARKTTQYAGKVANLATSLIRAFRQPACASSYCTVFIVLYACHHQAQQRPPPLFAPVIAEWARSDQRMSY